MKITILGCGGSFGSPLAWNRHGNIDLNNKRNFRTRSSVLIEDNNNKILIDDLRDDPEINCFISGNIDEINQVFVNLLENAIKYGFDNTNVIVRIEQLKNKEIKVSVINNGEGIPDKYIERLTERFFRVDKARSRKIGGTGLGLAIVKHILIKHRAQLSINSIPNQETNFSITFPIIN